MNNPIEAIVSALTVHNLSNDLEIKASARKQIELALLELLEPLAQENQALSQELEEVKQTVQDMKDSLANLALVTQSCYSLLHEDTTPGWVRRLQGLLNFKLF